MMSNETLQLKSIKSDSALINQTLKSTIERALVKKFLQGNERPCDKNDFRESKDCLEKFSLKIKQMVEFAVSGNFSPKCNEESKTKLCCKNIDNNLVTLLLIFCGQNNSIQPWNTEATVKNCELVFSQILRLFNCKDSSDLFSKKYQVNLARNILQILCCDLTSSTWKYFPASVVCYSWILKMIKQPELSEYLGWVLPPALLLTDDFVTENRIIGVQCLTHIIHNITIAELQLYGHGEVIFNALIPILRLREVDLIQFTILPLLNLTTKLEFDLGKKHQTKWSRFDNILEIYLENMELEQIIDLRTCYVKNLHILISKEEHKIVRWSKRLLRIFDEYVETAGQHNDERIIYYCVQAIEKFIELCNKAMFLYGKNLLLVLQKVLYLISSCNSDIQSKTSEITIQCIKKLQETVTETEKKDFQKNFINNLSGNSNCKKFYNQMYEIIISNK